MVGINAVKAFSIRNWLPKEARVLSFEMVEQDFREPLYRVKIEYEYEAQGKKRRATTYAFENQVFKASEIVDALGSSDPEMITAYVDPSDPDRAVVFRRSLLKYVIALVLSGFVALFLTSLSVGAFLKNVSQTNGP